MSALPKGPYTVTIEYTNVISSNPFTHKIELNCTAIGSPAPGVAAASVNLATKAGGSIAFSTGGNEFWNVFRLAMSSTLTSVSTCTLWRYDGPGTGDVFISAFTLTNAIGGLAGNPEAGHESMITLRTGLGRVMKVVYIEDINTSKARTAAVSNSLGTPYQRMAAYLMSANSWAHGRGGAFPVALMNETHTYNEAVESRRFRPNA